jgi:CDP-diacylglycerol--inositol 3-phosphatidyltransferase
MRSSTVFNIPNTIGYARIVFLVLSAFASSDLAFIALYSLSSGLDFLDGHAARLFNQCSILGACLDMITDRVGTVVISLRILTKHEHLGGLLALYLIFDLVSHFIHFHASALDGRHHKENASWMLKIYYNKTFLGLICLFSELFFISTYCFGTSGCLWHLLAGVAGVKMGFHIVQMLEAISCVGRVRGKGI